MSAPNVVISTHCAACADGSGLVLTPSRHLAICPACGGSGRRLRQIGPTTEEGRP